MTKQRGKDENQTVTNGPAGSKVLEQGPQNADVLGVDGVPEQGGLRGVRDVGAGQNDSMPRPSSELSGQSWADFVGPDGVTPMRQPEVLAAEPSIPGDADRQHAGRQPEGAAERTEAGAEALQAGAPSVGGQPEDRNSGGVEAAVVPGVRKVSPAPVAKQAGLTTAASGLMTLTSVQDQLAFAKRLIDERMISSTFKTASQVVVAIQWAISMKLEPVAALRQIYVVNGRPCLWGDGPMMLVQRSGQMESIEEFFVAADGKKICFENGNLKDEVYASVTRVKRRGDAVVQEDYFTLDDMERGGLTGKGDTWRKWTRIMCRYRARSLALKSKFPDLLNGMDIAEHSENFSPEMPDESRRAIKGAKADINAQFAEDMS